ncbi:MAG: hypothetical protein ACPGVG_15915 [Mycobacterium sp.]
MDARDADLVVPAECVAWCRVQQYGVLVLDDMATVDLDWWNDRLTKHAIPVRLTGRDPDGAITDRGVAVITRGDLTADPVGGGLGEVGVLYAAAAWLSGHRDRDRLRRFLDVRTTSSRAEHRFEVIIKALAACRQPHLLSIPQIAASNRRWSGWPRTPGVGAAVMSLYCWATHHDTAEPTEVRPQLLDQQAVASLIHLGWVANPVAAQFTWARYTRYCALLHAWAGQAKVPAELIEMWLVARWRERSTHRRSHTDQQHRQ